MAETAVEAARELREELLEILKQLNRAEMEGTMAGGLEVGELRHGLRGAYPYLSDPEVERAVGVLVGNGFAREMTDPCYAWDRGRTVGTRYAITTQGKAFLLERLVRANRVE